MKRLMLVLVLSLAVTPVQAQDARSRYNKEMADVAENAELCSGMFSLAVDKGWYSRDAAKLRRLRDLWSGWLERNRGSSAVSRARQVAETDANRFGSNYVEGMLRSCMARDPSVLEGDVEKRYVRSPTSPYAVPQGQLNQSYQYAAMCAGMLGSITEGGLSVQVNGGDTTKAFKYWNWHAGVLGSRLGRSTADKSIRTDGFGWLRGGGYVEGLFRVTEKGADFGSRCQQEGEMGYERSGGRF